MEKVLCHLRAPKSSESAGLKRYILAEDDLNAYLAYRVQNRPEKLVRKASVRLAEDAVTAYVTIDTDKIVSTAGGLSEQIFKELFAGLQNLEVSGQFSGQDGWGSYEVQRVRLNGEVIPPPLVKLILSQVPRLLDLPFDLTQSFPLPVGIQRIEVETGRVSIFD